METKSFTTLYVGQLTINHVYSLAETTISYARPVIAEIGGMPEAILTQLETANNAMGARMNRAQRDALTPEINKADADRDSCNSEIKREVKTASKSSNTAKKEAGEQLQLFLEPYWNSNKAALNTETEIVDQMLTAYEANADLQAAATTLGIAGLFTDLRSLNISFETLYNLRNSNEAASKGPSATDLKPDTVKIYEQFCTAMEQAETFTPTDAVTTLFNKMDTLRKTYIALPEGSSKKKAGKTGTGSDE